VIYGGCYVTSRAMRREREDALKRSTPFNGRIVNITRRKYNSNAYTWREWNKSHIIGEGGREIAFHVARHKYFFFRGTSCLVNELSNL
jgi:hypothetical protein